MRFLVIFLLVAVAHYAASEGTVSAAKPAANQPAYQAVHQPYNYRPYGVSNYGYDNTYSSRYGSYPSSHDLGSQHLVLSGGIYRPYDYADEYGYNSGYKPYAYDNTYKYYDNSAARYVRNPYGQQAAVYY